MRIVVYAGTSRGVVAVVAGIVVAVVAGFVVISGRLGGIAIIYRNILKTPLFSQ
ncbi:hypothetical protein HQ545_06200 [Candidatus Woesearchaeota archaeon]|nr:hypothetical protein [Candidatus Woesearchaeota archaeon]